MTRRRLTILLSMVPESLEDHLEMNIGRFDTYASSPTLSRKLRRLTPIVVVLFPWSWTHSRGTTKAKEKAQKAKPKMIRAIPTRTWFATCATRKAIARPIVGTQRPMEALVNHQVRRAVPSPTPRVAKERGNRKVKATGKAPKARLEGEAEGDQAAEQEWPDGDEPERDSCAWPEGRVLVQYRPRVAQGHQWTGRPLPGSCARSTATSPGSGRGLGTTCSRSAREIEVKRTRPTGARCLTARDTLQLMAWKHTCGPSYRRWVTLCKSNGMPGRSRPNEATTSGQSCLVRRSSSGIPCTVGRTPVWVHLPREPDYSKHKDKYEPEQEGEEEEMQSVEEEEIQSVESSEEEESAQVSAEEGESEVEVEVEETSGDERKSVVSAPFPLHDPGHQFLAATEVEES